MNVIKVLVAIVLLEMAMIGLVISLRDVFDLQTAAYWQRQYYSEHFENDVCNRKHTTLIKQIKKEGLWTRLGMGGQPWLQ